MDDQHAASRIAAGLPDAGRFDPEEDAPFPGDWEFQVDRGVPMPANIRVGGAIVHAFVFTFDKMRHDGESVFIPRGYWLAKGRPLQQVNKPGWQRQVLGALFSGWKRKDPSRQRLWLLTQWHAKGEDPVFPQHEGVRGWIKGTGAAPGDMG